jgi:hypothetical protein
MDPAFDVSGGSLASPDHRDPNAFQDDLVGDDVDGDNTSQPTTLAGTPAGANGDAQPPPQTVPAACLACV